MRILQLVQKPQRRGAEVFAWRLTDRIRKEGHDARIIYLYSYSGPGALPCEDRACILNGQPDHIFEKFPGWHPKLVRDLNRIIQEFRPDVIQMNGARTVKYGALIRSFHRAPNWVLIYRNIGDPEEWLRGSLKRTLYKKLLMPKANGIVAVSNSALEALRNFYKPVVPMVAIPTGFDDSVLAPTASRSQIRASLSTNMDSPVVIFVGSLTNEKRVDRLFRIFRKVRSDLPDVHLWLIGDGPLRSALEKEASDMQESIRFLGARDDVGSYLNAADLFVLTSDTEGIPASILEAGFFGLPAVASRVGSISECVLEGETGFLADPNDEESFAALVVRLLKNSKEREMLGSNAKRWITEHFRMDVIAQRYLGFYEMVFNRR